MRGRYTKQQLMAILVSVHTPPHLTHTHTHLTRTPHTLHTHTEVLEYLLSGGAPVNEAILGGATPLHYAVAAGHMTCIQILLQYNADVNAMATNEEVSVYNPGIMLLTFDLIRVTRPRPLTMPLATLLRYMIF